MEKSNFVDQIRIFCRTGHGGAGSKHFMRTKFNAMAGPDGGDGGRGAHIILKGNKNLWTLLHLRYYKNVLAEDGKNGDKNNMTGRDGKDIIIEVPLGTIARDEETETKEAEIMEDGQTVIWLKGGRGGLGNSNFATPTNQAPEYAQPGEAGIEGWKVLELKVLADVGLVGFPNAGKSTLLSVDHRCQAKDCGLCFYDHQSKPRNGGIPRRKIILRCRSARDHRRCCRRKGTRSPLPQAYRKKSCVAFCYSGRQQESPRGI